MYKADRDSGPGSRRCIFRLWIDAGIQYFQIPLGYTVTVCMLFWQSMLNNVSHLISKKFNIYNQMHNKKSTTKINPEFSFKILPYETVCSLNLVYCPRNYLPGKIFRYVLRKNF